jgi:serine/threonine protein kinase
MAADVYSFACTAFEVLTGTLLFDADDEMSLVNAHLLHDGWPPRLSVLSAMPEYADLCVVLSTCLRRDPPLRPSVSETRRAFASATRRLHDELWPLHGEAVTELTG